MLRRRPERSGPSALPTEPRRRDGAAAVRVAVRAVGIALPGPSARGDRRLPRRSAVRCLVVVGGARPCVVCGWVFRQVPGHRCRSGWCAGRSVVSPSFGLTRPLRPRFGLSDRRPSSLRSASISSPQRPFSAFFPWSLRAHSSRDKKASPWPSSTALRPFGCGPIASGQRQPSRSRWSRPEKRKRTRTWLPSATSPPTATA